MSENAESAHMLAEVRPTRVTRICFASGRFEENSHFESDNAS